MSTKHYPYMGGNFDRIIFDGDGSVWVPESENDKLRELVHRLISHVEHPPCEGCMAEMNCDGEHVTQCDEWLFMVADARKLGIEVDA